MKHINTYANIAEHDADINRDPYNSVSYIKDENRVEYNLMIKFADPEVRRILTTDFGLPIQGEGFYREDIQSITDLGESFTDNELIETFEEFKYFTGVTELDATCFSGCTSLTKIYIPDSITNIITGAFTNCTSLTHLIIGNGITEIIGDDFEDCVNLEYIEFGTGMTRIQQGSFMNLTELNEIIFKEGNNPLEIIHSAFRGCTSLTSLITPHNTVTVGSSFIGCTSLTNVIINGTNATIDVGSFSECVNLTNLVIGNGVIHILSGAFCDNPILEEIIFEPGGRNIILENIIFSNLPSITSLTFPDGFSKIINGPFDLKNLETLIFEDGDSNTELRASFGYCANLTKLVIGSSIGVIGSSCFSSLPNLTELEFSNGNTPLLIKSGSFLSATILTTINLPDRLNVIPSGMLTSFMGLENITVDNNNEYLSAIDGILYNKDITKIITYPKNKPNTNYTIPSSITSIDEYCFINVININNIIFESETPLESVDWITELPETISFYVPDESVDLYKAATGWIAFADRIYPFSEGPFEVSGKFADPEVGRVLHANELIASPTHSTREELATITSLGNYFNSNRVITQFPELKYCTGVTNLIYTFSGCSNLTSAPDIPESVTNLIYTFSGCTSLTTAPDIPEGVTDLSYTFRDCSNLTKAPVIPEGVTSLYYTFSGCSNLTKAPVIPEGVTDLSYTFRDCSNLTKAPVIPEGVTDLSYTFFGCSNIDGIYIINIVTPVSYTVSLSNVQAIYVPDASVSAYKTASGWTQFADKIYPMSTKP